MSKWTIILTFSSTLLLFGALFELIRYVYYKYNYLPYKPFISFFWHEAKEVILKLKYK
jgi:hypothetical protein